ncbi:MAG TPA: outer membrane beta-barrel protein [Verrucomicrobiae bacterium]|jgi:hypothetical protein|nr:outer membrane beta-barrel protein [Verrucomicrobiae bacterium]HEX4264183.1 outer membrane beta-barrel protein [Verrucomicrobiae bacterium]
MKKVIASASLLAIGAVGVYSARADWAAGADKPWSVSATLRGFYDSNYNTEPNGSIGKRSSFGYEIRPQASVSWSDGPTTLSASYTYSLKYFEDRPGDKADQSHDVELAFTHAFDEHNKMDVEESFIVSQEPEVLAGGGAITLPVRANGDNIHNNFALNYDLGVSRLLSFVIGYANSYYDYTGALPPGTVNTPSYATSLNRVEQTFTLNSRWMVQPETTFIAGYQLLWVDYLRGGNLTPGFVPPIQESPQLRNNFTHNLYLGVEHSFFPNLTFSGRAGVQISDYYNSDRLPTGNTGAASIGPFADLSLSYQYIDTGSLTVGFRQSRNQTDVAANANGSLTQDQESSTVYGSVNQTLSFLSPKLVASLTAQYQNSVYEGGSTFNNEADQYYLFGANFSYQFTHYFSAETGYNYDLVSSDVPGRGYDRNRVYIGVTASY